MTRLASLASEWDTAPWVDAMMRKQQLSHSLWSTLPPARAGSVARDFPWNIVSSMPSATLRFLILAGVSLASETASIEAHKAFASAAGPSASDTENRRRKLLVSCRGSTLRTDSWARTLSQRHPPPASTGFCCRKL